MNTAKIKSTLLESLEKAGKEIKRSINLKKSIEKKSALSLVTQVDKKCEKIIIQVVQKAFPDHALLTEESPPIGSSSSRWIVDPLDGTTNFAHSYPVASVSIAYEEKGVLMMGGVYDPFKEELFLGIKGGGAFLNGKKIKVSPTKKLSESLLCTGFPYDRNNYPDDYLSLFKAYMIRVQGIRRTGSAALDISYVACGRFDGFWETKLQAWDKAAAMVILEEAGGTLTNFTGKRLTIDDVQNVVSNGKIHAEMIAITKKFLIVGTR